MLRYVFFGPRYFLESCSHLHVDGVVVGVFPASCTVVGEGVVELEEQIFAEPVIASYSVVRVHGCPCVFVVAVAVVMSEDFELFGHWNSQRGIPCVGAVGGTGICCHPADGAHVFSSEGPLAFIFQSATPAYAFHAFQLSCRVVSVVFFVGVFAVPPESSDGEVFHGREPEASDEVFVVVFVGVVDALSVEEAHLIVEQLVVVGSGEYVALELYAKVATRTFVVGSFAVAVVDGSEFHGCLGIGSATDGQRAHGVFKSEGTFELPEFDAQKIIFLPFDEGVEHARPLVFSWRSVHFELEFIIEILVDVAIGIEADEAEIEASVCGLSFSVVDGIFAHDVAAEFHGGLHFLHEGGGGFRREDVARRFVVGVLKFVVFMNVFCVSDKREQGCKRTE